MTVLEALASSTPVIGSRMVAWQVGDAGRIIDGSSFEPYAWALSEVADAAVLAELREKALRRAKLFDWSSTVAVYERVLDEVVAL